MYSMPVVQCQINSIPMQESMCTKMIYQPGTLRKVCEITVQRQLLHWYFHLILDAEFIHTYMI